MIKENNEMGRVKECEVNMHFERWHVILALNAMTDFALTLTLNIVASRAEPTLVTA